MSGTIKAIERHMTPRSKRETVDPHAPKLVGEWQQRGPETFSGYALKKCAWPSRLRNQPNSQQLTGGEWFWNKEGARTGNAAHYGEVAVGLNIMPNRWINFRPELRGDFASEPAFGSVSSSHRERSQFTAAFDVILKFH